MDEIYTIYDYAPNKRQRYIKNTEFFFVLFELEKRISYIDNMMFRKKKDNDEYFNVINEAISYLKKVQMTLYILLLNTEVSDNKVKILENLLHDIHYLLYRIIDKDSQVNIKYVLYKRSEFPNAIVLNKLKELIATTYHQTVVWRNNPKDIRGKYFVYETVIEAYAYVYMANSIFPSTAEDSQKRLDLFNKALSSLNLYDNLLYRLFLENKVNNDIVLYWIDLYVQCVKIVDRLRQDDMKKTSTK